MDLVNTIQSKKQQLEDIYDRHDRNVRLLFHLEKFVSLVSFDPQVAQQDHSDVFENYKIGKYDLLSSVSTESRSTRRRAHQQIDALNALGGGSLEAITSSLPSHSKLKEKAELQKQTLKKEAIKKEKEKDNNNNADGGSADSNANSNNHSSIKNKRKTPTTKQSSIANSPRIHSASSNKKGKHERNNSPSQHSHSNSHSKNSNSKSKSQPQSRARHSQTSSKTLPPKQNQQNQQHSRQSQQSQPTRVSNRIRHKTKRKNEESGDSGTENVIQIDDERGDNYGYGDYNGDDQLVSSSEGYISEDFDPVLFLDSTPEPSEVEESDSESEVEAEIEAESKPNDDKTQNADKDSETAIKPALKPIPRIKFKFSLPGPTVTHPGHITHSQYKNLDQFLDSFVSLDDDISKEDCETYIQEQAELRTRINELKQNGMYDLYLEYMKDTSGASNNNNNNSANGSNGTGNNNNTANSNSSSNTNTNIPTPTTTTTVLSSSKPFAQALVSSLRKTNNDPLFHKTTPTFQDHLVTQAVFFSKLMSDERKAHTSKSKKMSTMIDMYFKRLSGAEEKGRKLEEKRIKQLARKTAYEVLKKWKIAEKVVQHRRAKKLEDEQRKAGKQQLNRILKQSAQLLEARVGTAESATTKTDPVVEEGGEDDEANETAEVNGVNTFDESEDGSYFGSDEKEDSGNEEEAEEDEDEDEDELMDTESEDESEQEKEVEQDKKDEFSEPSKSTNDSDADLSNIPDSQLTVEQLKKKYSSLPDIPMNFEYTEESQSESGSESSSEREYEPKSQSRLRSRSKLRSRSQSRQSVTSVDKDESSVAAKNEIDTDAKDEPNSPKSTDSSAEYYSDSDHSTVMDSEEEDSDSEEDVEDTGPGLAALLAPMKDDQPEKDSEPVEKPSENNEPSKPTDTAEPNGTLAQTTVTTTSTPTPAPTTSTEIVKTQVPFLLRGSLREYQHFGLDWLAGLYNSNTNGILADEMGLGKTIQTIALISYLACEKQVWGPHLIVVPTSVMLNWEMEFKRFAPGFKVLTYYGTPVQRKQKRQGWNKEDTWHVCITSYQLVLQDQNAFKRKKWHYMILDEAHNIKNFRSQRWQSLLNFNTQHRLLLTGTPLQNNLMELWSLLYFLMPSGRPSEVMPQGFADLRNFQEWFSRPVEKMVQGGEYVDEEVKETISKLHQILRPYLLRRLKADVEKQMPAKYEHVVYCKLSKRQRFLYDDFMSRAQTRETLASGNFLSIINCLMQLRKVCNHPDLFEVRPIVTSLAVERSVSSDFEIKDFLVRKRIHENVSEESLNTVNLDFLNLRFTQNDISVGKNESISTSKWGDCRRPLIQEILTDAVAEVSKAQIDTQRDLSSINGHLQYTNLLEKQDELVKLESTIYQSHYKCERTPMYGTDLINKLSTMVSKPPPARGYDWTHSDVISSMKLSYEEREAAVAEVIDRYAFVTPKVVCLNLPQQVLGPQVSELLGTMPASSEQSLAALDEMSKLELSYNNGLGLNGAVNNSSEVANITSDNTLANYPNSSMARMTSDLQKIQSQNLFHRSLVKLSIAFPDKRLLQFDCGKLQRLATLLHDLISNGHRALIFTQMTRVLDILEQFLNLHGYRYLRLDGATPIDQRQISTERFNQDTRIPIFILSTRSGGLGINLTGADTVIFYDSDWNPSMDRQCQDRCHRIGQTRDVHIYRLVSEYTIESNILKKAQQKTMLDNVVIQEGEFTTDYLTKLSIRDMLGDDSIGGHANETVFGESVDGNNDEGKNEGEGSRSGSGSKMSSKRLETVLATAEDDEDAKAARLAMREVNNLDAEDFDEPQKVKKKPGILSSVKTDKEAKAGARDRKRKGGDDLDDLFGQPQDSVAGTVSATSVSNSKQGSQSLDENNDDDGDEDMEDQDGNEEDGEEEEDDVEDGEDDEEMNEEGINSVDDYMIRFIENGYFWD